MGLVNKAISLAPGGGIINAGLDVLGGILSSSDPERDKGRCDTAQEAVNAALSGTTVNVADKKLGRKNVEPIQWIAEQAKSSGSEKGKACYRAARSILEQNGLYGVASPTGNGASIAPGTPVGQYREGTAPGGMMLNTIRSGAGVLAASASLAPVFLALALVVGVGYGAAKLAKG